MIGARTPPVTHETLPKIRPSLFQVLETRIVVLPPRGNTTPACFDRRDAFAENDRPTPESDTSRLVCAE